MTPSAPILMRACPSIASIMRVSLAAASFETTRLLALAGTLVSLPSTETVTVRPDVTVDVVLRYLRMRADLPDQSQARGDLLPVDADDDVTVLQAGLRRG